MDLTPHTLGEYCALLEPQLAAPLPEGLDLSQSVALVSCDSQEVVPGTLFLCKGAHFKPEFLDMAREQGALAYVSQTPYPQAGLPCIQVSDIRLAIAPLQDVLGLGADARINIPGTTGPHNWSWRVRQDALNSDVSGRLKHITRTYRRG